MVVMLNEKFRENVPAWEGFAAYPAHIPVFFQRLFQADRGALRMHERVSFLVFFIHAFQSLEHDAVSKQVLRLVQLPLWHSLSPGRRQVAFLQSPIHPLQILCPYGTPCTPGACWRIQSPHRVLFCPLWHSLSPGRLRASSDHPHSLVFAIVAPSVPPGGTRDKLIPYSRLTVCLRHFTTVPWASGELR